MKKIATLAIAVTISASASAQFFAVVPNDRENTAGTSVFIFFAAPRTYQFLVHEDQLTSLAGLDLNGISWRLPGAAADPWPPADINISNFDIYIGPGIAPANMTNVFANNAAGAMTQVRSGALTVPTGAFPATGTPRDWGIEIGFDPWQYTGGHLLVEVRYDTSFSPSRSLDANGTTAPGYGTQYRAWWGGGYDATTGTTGSGNFVITRLSAVPEPGTLIALGAGLAFLASRRRRK